MVHDAREPMPPAVAVHIAACHENHAAAARTLRPSQFLRSRLDEPARSPMREHIQPSHHPSLPRFHSPSSGEVRKWISGTQFVGTACRIVGRSPPRSGHLLSGSSLPAGTQPRSVHVISLGESACIYGVHSSFCRVGSVSAAVSDISRATHVRSRPSRFASGPSQLYSRMVRRDSRETNKDNVFQRLTTTRKDGNYPSGSSDRHEGHEGHEGHDGPEPPCRRLAAKWSAWDSRWAWVCQR